MKSVHAIIYCSFSLETGTTHVNDPVLNSGLATAMFVVESDVNLTTETLPVICNGEGGVRINVSPAQAAKFVFYLDRV